MMDINPHSVLFICVSLCLIMDVLNCCDVKRTRDRRSDAEEDVLNRNESWTVDFLDRFNEIATDIYSKESFAEWIYYTNLTAFNGKLWVCTICRTIMYNFKFRLIW